MSVGVDSPTQYSCEAHNTKGVTVSREAQVNIKGRTSWIEFACIQTKFPLWSWKSVKIHEAKASTQLSCIFVSDIPAKVSKITVVKREANKLNLSWTPGHDGFSPLKDCHITVNNLTWHELCSDLNSNKSQYSSYYSCYWSHWSLKKFWMLSDYS